MVQSTCGCKRWTDLGTYRENCRKGLKCMPWAGFICELCCIQRNNSVKMPCVTHSPLATELNEGCYKRLIGTRMCDGTTLTTHVTLRAGVHIIYSDVLMFRAENLFPLWNTKISDWAVKTHGPNPSKLPCACWSGWRQLPIWLNALFGVAFLQRNFLPLYPESSFVPHWC